MYDCGSSSRRWDDVYATNGSINTSDRNEKQQIEELSPAELRVASAISVKKFKWNSAVEAKGDAARTHVGVIAQEVIAAFEAEGLDAFDYGLVGRNNVNLSDDAFATNNDNPIWRYNVRYTELQAFITAALTQKLEQLDVRIAALE